MGQEPSRAEEPYNQSPAAAAAYPTRVPLHFNASSVPQIAREQQVNFTNLPRHVTQHIQNLAALEEDDFICNRPFVEEIDSGDEENVDPFTCPVCHLNPLNCVLLPCHHRVMCRRCAEVSLHTRGVCSECLAPIRAVRSG